MLVTCNIQTHTHITLLVEHFYMPSTLIWSITGCNPFTITCHFSAFSRFTLSSIVRAFTEKNASGLLENDDIVVSRRANSYVFTAVAKKTYQPKKANGLEAMLRKAGAEGITVTTIKTFDSDTEKEADITVVPTSEFRWI